MLDENIKTHINNIFGIVNKIMDKDGNFNSSLLLKHNFNNCKQILLNNS